MALGLFSSYGTFASFLARFLYPSRPSKKEWLFLADLSRMKEGESLSYVAPSGEKIAVARRGSSGTASDFIALSSTCPHLGCQVHWEASHSRFFCPCHNGAFNPEGKAIAGPPAEAGQSLSAYPLKIEGGVLFIEAPLERLDNQGRSLAPPEMPYAGIKSGRFLQGGR